MLLVVYSLWLMSLPLVVVLLLSMLLVMYFVGCWRQYVSLQSHRSVTALNWNVEDKRLEVRLRSGQWVNVTDIEQRVVWPWLAAIRVSGEGEMCRGLNIIVLPDSLTRFESYRQFRVFCRLARIRDASVLSDPRSQS